MDNPQETQNQEEKQKQENQDDEEINIDEVIQKNSKFRKLKSIDTFACHSEDPVDPVIQEQAPNEIIEEEIQIKPILKNEIIDIRSKSISFSRNVIKEINENSNDEETVEESQMQKRLSVSQRNFPAYSILKNGPLVQPGEFKKLKNIDKLSNPKHEGEGEQNQNEQIKQEEEERGSSDDDDEDDLNESTEVKFIGEAVIQENVTFKHSYQPDENPKRSILQRKSCFAGLSQEQTSQLFERNRKKRMSYDFNNLKNVDGNIIKKSQSSFTKILNEEELKNSEKCDTEEKEEIESQEKIVHFDIDEKPPTKGKSGHSQSISPKCENSLSTPRNIMKKTSFSSKQMLEKKKLDEINEQNLPSPLELRGKSKSTIQSIIKLVIKNNKKNPQKENFEQMPILSSQIIQNSQQTHAHTDLKLEKLLSIQQWQKSLDEQIFYSQNADFDRISIIQGNYTKEFHIKEEFKKASQSVLKALKYRDSYKFLTPNPDQFYQKYVEFDEEGNPFINWNNQIVHHPKKLENAVIDTSDGIIKVIIDGVNEAEKIPSMMDYMEDILNILEIVNNKVNKTICQNRIVLLNQKFTMHQTLNGLKELLDQKQIYHRDFYNTIKVDTHIHHSASMNALELLNFIKQKLDQDYDQKVYLSDDNQPLTLGQVFEQYGIRKEHLSLDNLNVKADQTLYQRFDNFNNKYNPFGSKLFREIFMKTDNYIEGKYLAELTQNVIQKNEKNKYVYTEWRLSIYGKNREEWKKIAKWVNQNKLQSPNNRWMIQIPRLFNLYKQMKILKSFQEMIDNIFYPLFEVTVDPQVDPDLFQFLNTIGGFDTVDDESSYEEFFLNDLKTVPEDWTQEKNPHYAYWIYYIYANITSLNILRKSRNLNTFSFRPHCGEAGNIDHLVSAFLLCEGINHGIVLEKSPVLQYLFYLKQIGMAISPVSNNKLFVKYEKQPFYKFFKIGLNVSLSTDDPLILHMTNDPLLEEYSIVSQIWDLSAVDIAEIARNSVKQCSFESIIKHHWAGFYENLERQDANKPFFSNLPVSRYNFRRENLLEEFQFLKQNAQC